jgi:hypothetical protein
MEDVEEWALCLALDKQALRTAYQRYNKTDPSVNVVESPCFYITKKWAQMEAAIAS